MVYAHAVPAVSTPPPPISPDPIALEVLQGNVQLLAEKERLELERLRLIELDRLKSEFLARVSHDLRTPLSSIIGFSDLMLTGEGGKLNKKHLDCVQAISRNGHQLLALINELLDLSSLESGQLKIRLAEVPLADLLADLRAATEPVLRAAQLQVGWQSVAALDGKHALVDRRRILQVLVNLVDNARKFTPAGGHVAVTLDADVREFRATVADSGPGIPEIERDRLFRSFTHTGPGPIRGEGVGLGLAIVKAIVDQHGGSITVGGGITGTGCTFRVRIPQAR